MKSPAQSGFLSSPGTQVSPKNPSRRGFLQMGALGLGGFTLPRLLQAEAASGIRSSTKSVILIYLVGGPPHQDMFDLKPNAPKEIAGPWKPISTNIPGIQICEAFPRLAQMMDKFALIRSLVGNQADHDASQVFHGHNPQKLKPEGGWFPSLVSVIPAPMALITSPDQDIWGNPSLPFALWAPHAKT